MRKSLLNKNKTGFTLAEVLITLGIIGIVAAMTIPTLIAKYREIRTVSTLKETFSMLSQGLKLLEEQDEGKPEEWDIQRYDGESAILIANKFKKVLKVAVDCGVTNENNCIYNGGYTYLNDRSPYNYAADNRIYKLQLLNGSAIMLNGGSPPKLIKILIDTNGQTPPNKWGMDLFEIDYMIDIGLVLDGNPQQATTNWNPSCSTIGWGCAYYVVTFGNMDYLHKKKK